MHIKLFLIIYFKNKKLKNRLILIQIIKKRIILRLLKHKKKHVNTNIAIIDYLE